MSLRTGEEIFRNSLQVVRQHPGLLIFPLLVIATVLLLFVLLLQPVFGVSVDEVRAGLWNHEEGRDAVRALAAAIRDPLELPWLWLAVGWLAGTLVLTFIHAAFCSQIISVLNGGEFSVVRGFGDAYARLPAIRSWALFAGTAGLVVTVIERTLWFVAILLDVIGVSMVMRRLTAMPSLFFGVPWSAAAQFVVPVILREPGVCSPMRCLRTSAEMVRRTWGDSLVIGIVGPSALGFVAAFAVLGVFQAVGSITRQDSLVVWGALACFCIFCLADGLNRIFRCGLYIYATEGVVPGPFDADLFNRVWTIR